MLTHLAEMIGIDCGSPYASEKREILLATSREELASLRFSIIVTARWERSASEDQDVERRDDLRADLEVLRRNYSEKIDEIAMTFGVDCAMKAQTEVERTVTCSQVIEIPVHRFERSEDHDPGI